MRKATARTVPNLETAPKITLKRGACIMRRLAILSIELLLTKQIVLRVAGAAYSRWIRAKRGRLFLSRA
jgi:hypothetical protein